MNLILEAVKALFRKAENAILRNAASVKALIEDVNELRNETATIRGMAENAFALAEENMFRSYSPTAVTGKEYSHELRLTVDEHNKLGDCVIKLVWHREISSIALINAETNEVFRIAAIGVKSPIDNFDEVTLHHPGYDNCWVVYDFEHFNLLERKP